MSEGESVTRDDDEVPFPSFYYKNGTSNNQLLIIRGAKEGRTRFFTWSGLFVVQSVSFFGGAVFFRRKKKKETKNKKRETTEIRRESKQEQAAKKQATNKPTTSEHQSPTSWLLPPTVGTDG